MCISLVSLLPLKHRLLPSSSPQREGHNISAVDCRSMSCPVGPRGCEWEQLSFRGDTVGVGSFLHGALPSASVLRGCPKESLPSSSSTWAPRKREGPAPAPGRVCKLLSPSHTHLPSVPLADRLKKEHLVQSAHPIALSSRDSREPLISSVQ